MVWLKEHVLAWAVSAALAITMLQLVVPPIFDWIFDFIVIGLVWVAATLAKTGKVVK